jgi:uncharacterized membrane protein YciS (DUF1049 family)
VVVLGLVLLVLCVAVGTAVALANTSATSVEAAGYSLSGLTLGGLFLVGMAVGALALLGLLMMLGGARRKRARRAALQHEVRDVRSERETLAEENARLQAELEQERSVYPAERSAAPETVEGRGKHAL